MADSSGGAVASAAVTALGNYAVQAASNKRQFKFQKEAMSLQDEYNRSLWDYQNAYNTPQQQMERFKAAGLNPHLIYGQSQPAGNAGPIEPATVPTRQAATADVPDAMFRYLQARQMDAQYQATTQNTENAAKRGAILQVQGSLENLKLMKEAISSKNYKDLAEAEKSTRQFMALRMQELFANEKTKGGLLTQHLTQRGENFKRDIEIKDLDIAFKKDRNELSKFGIYSSDHPALRILMQAAQRQGIDLHELLSKGVDKLQYLFNGFK